MTYSLTIAAAAEILKANVSAEDDALAFLVFAVASILTIVAPIVSLSRHRIAPMSGWQPGANGCSATHARSAWSRSR